MSRKLHYALMTQNEAFELIPNIERVLPFVDSVTVVDGGSKDQTIYYLRNWQKVEPKLRFFVHPWQDDFPAQRNNYVKRVAEIAQEGDWLLTADPDEYYDVQALEKLHKAADRAERDGLNMIGFQCRSVSMQGPKRVWENLDDYWKQLFIKWNPDFHYTGYKCHEGKGGVPHHIMNTSLIYEHVKQENVIWIRGHRNLYTAGGGPNLGDRNPAWKKLKNILAGVGVNTWHQYYEYMLRGSVTPELKQLYIDHMLEGREGAGPNAISSQDWDGSSEMREMYKSYFRLLHPEEEPEELRSIHID